MHGNTTALTVENFWQVSLVEDLVLAFVNARGDNGNSALHLSVMHSKKQAIQWLLSPTEDIFKEAKGRGRPALTFLNKNNLTPLTLSVRMAQENHENLEAFETILTSAYSALIWAYGDMEMRTQNLFQMDTFRVKDKKLHNKKLNPEYASALEIVVNFEVPVLTALPVFEELIRDKWTKFGMRFHWLYAIIPYSIFVLALTVSTLARTALVREAQLALGEAADEATTLDIKYDREAQIAIACDVITYALSVPFLFWNSWFHNRLRRRYLDVNEDMKISWREMMMYLFKNFNTILCALIAMLLVVILILRFLEQPLWLQVSRESVTAGTREHELLTQELDLLGRNSKVSFSDFTC